MNKEDVIKALMNAAYNCITDSELRDHFEQIIFGNHFDHQKAKIPREVGEELDAYKRHGNEIYDLIFDLITYSEKLDATSHYIPDDSVERSDRLNAVIDAYRYGWESEPEAKWYVQAPKEWCTEFTFWMCKDGSKVYPTLQKYMDYPAFNQQFQFTRAELKKYHLDSDIFTLVPVENEEVSR